MSISRRGLFGLLAGAAAIPLVKHLPNPGFNWNGYGEAIAPTSSVTMAELTSITRTAFIPRVLIQIYTQHPMLTLLQENADGQTPAL